MGLGCVEGWRGPVLVALESGPGGTIRRCHPHDPSWSNWPVLEHAVIGNIVPGFSADQQVVQPLVQRAGPLDSDAAHPAPDRQTGIRTEAAPAPADDMVVVARLQEKILKTLGRALTIRQVDAGSCNGCELEIHALGNPYYNIEGMGIKFVASPRHADMLLVTGPVSQHMAIALQRTYDATPEPKLVVAVGDCGCTGGIFGESYASLGRVANVIPVDVQIPGCPPTPTALLQGILAAIGAHATEPVAGGNGAA